MQYDLVSMIIPAYNERESIDELFQRVAAVLNSRQQPFEFIVIDDGSSDGMFELLEQMIAEHDEVQAVRHYRNNGKSLGLMQGFDVARGDVAIMMDADLQDQPEMIPAFLDKIAEGYDLVNGWRNKRKDTARKRLVSRVFNRLTRRIFNCQVHDINCGFKAMRREVYKSLQLRGDMHRLIPAWVAGKGFRVTEIPVPHEDRKHGQSKYKLLRHRGLLDIVALTARNTVRYHPFHVYCEAAAFFWAVAVLCLGGWGLSNWLLPDGSVPGSLLSVACIGVGAWSVLVGTVLPLFGFHMEIESARAQDATWRDSLVQQRVGGRSSEAPDVVKAVDALWAESMTTSGGAVRPQQAAETPEPSVVSQ